MNIIDKYILIIICHNLTDFNEKITKLIIHNPYSHVSYMSCPP